MQKLIHQIKEKFPELISKDTTDDKYATYRILSIIGKYCAIHLRDDDGQIILDMISKAYNRNSLLLSNSIENEFFYSMISNMDNEHLKDNLNFIPDKLKLTFIKVLLDTQNTTVK